MCQDFVLERYQSSLFQICFCVCHTHSGEYLEAYLCESPPQTLSEMVWKLNHAPVVERIKD